MRFQCLSFALLFSVKVVCGQNFLLVSVDTLRADHLSCYGYRGNRTPSIDRWAAEGILFERAYSEYPLTLPAHSTLLTGTYPFYHGVRENVGFVLSSDQVTLAEALREKGYATAGFAGCYVLASQFGIGQGFDTYDDDFGTPLETVNTATALRRTAGQVTDRFLSWLEKHRTSRFFAFVHFYDPHAPRPEGYDREVTRVDQSIGRIDAFLRASNLLTETHIFLVSDHGESLGEHKESGHGFFLYDATLHVPLIVRPAASAALPSGVVRQAASLADVMPTILQLAGLKAPRQVQGTSLVPAMRVNDAADRGLYAETYVPELQFGWSPLRSYRLGNYVFIDAPRPEFYDTAADPGETRNLISKNAALSREYRDRLREFAARHPSRRPPDGVSAGPGPEVLDRLASLGYVQLKTSRASGNFAAGVDPKDRITAFENYHSVLNQIGTGRVHEDILDRIGALREMAPEVKSLYFLEAQALAALGRIPEAQREYRQGLAIEPGNNIARAGYANLLLRAGQMKQAEEEFRRVISMDPRDYRSRSNLAGIYAAQGKTDAALAEIRLALKTNPGYAAGWQNLGRLFFRSHDWKNAETAIRKALSIDPNNASAHYLLAQILNALGRKAEAAGHLKTALRLDPALAQRK